MAFETRTIDQLTISPHNARKSGPGDLTNLKASIEARGLILPLVVHRMRGSNKTGILAGSRKYRAIKELLAEGRWEADRPIDVKVVEGDDRALADTSLHEDLMRRDLSPAETFAAIARSAKRGGTPEQLAAELGQPLIWVRQALRLGNLAPELLAAFETGTINEAQARAFAATEDHALQRLAWQQLADAPSRDARAIRAALKVGDAELQRLLRFVGADRYRAAGGGFEPDLFDEAGDRGRITDEGMLRALADALLSELKDEVRAAAGRPDLRFAAEAPRNDWGTDWQLQIGAEFAAGSPLTLPAGDVVATLTLTDAGEPQLGFWWESRKAKRDAERAAALDQRGPAAAAPPPSPAAPVASPVTARDSFARDSYAQRRNVVAEGIARAEHGLTQDGLQIFRSIRRAMLRALLVEDARAGRAVGHDYLIWSLLRAHFRSSGIGREGRHVTGAAPLGSIDRDPAIADPHLAAQPAVDRFAHALAELEAMSFIAEPDPAAALIDFLNAPAATKNLAAAVVAGLALERSLNAPGYSIPAHDTLALMTARATPPQLRRNAAFVPTAALLDLLPKQQRIDLAAPFVERKTFAAWAKLKAAEMTRQVLAVLEGRSPAFRFGKGDEALEWVHPLLAFPQAGPASRPAADDPPPDNDQADLERATQAAAEDEYAAALADHQPEEAAE